MRASRSALHSKYANRSAAVVAGSSCRSPAIFSRARISPALGGDVVVDLDITMVSLSLSPWDEAIRGAPGWPSWCPSPALRGLAVGVARGIPRLGPDRRGAHG